MVLDDIKAVFTQGPIHTVSRPRQLGVSRADTQVPDVNQLGPRQSYLVCSWAGPHQASTQV